MKYISTRGAAPALSFVDVTLAGLASDGGLYVPEAVPVFSAADIAGMKNLSYPELALRIITPFIGDEIPQEVLRNILTETYAQFDHPDVAPLKKLGDNEYLLELFHGPTLAFKDFALQFLGRLMEHILTSRGQSATVVGATSGDTGSAAIAGFAGRAGMKIFILHPKGRVSDVQRKQMTTIADPNVFNLAVEGTFDDCQNIVKELFADQALRDSARLVAVNSINWSRILAQVVYYFYAALKLGAPQQKIHFCVPTGNFGDIYAGYIAKRMGLPIGQLIIATNSNDILARCLENGSYRMEGVVPTHSPSMDIQISSNFERLLFDLHGQDAKAVTQLMQELRSKRQFTLSPEVHQRLRAEFCAHAVNNEQTQKTITDVHDHAGEVIDPHTAVGVAAGHALWKRDLPLVILATAHPAKFPDVVKKACGLPPAAPDHLTQLMNKPERLHELPNATDKVRDFITGKLK